MKIVLMNILIWVTLLTDPSISSLCSATPPQHLCVQSSGAASPVLSINPSKLIMLLRRR